MLEIDFTENLRNLMQTVGYESFKSLSRAAGVSQWQILQLRRGKIGQMRIEVLIKLSEILQISWTELVENFSVDGLSSSFHKTHSSHKKIDLLNSIVHYRINKVQKNHSKRIINFIPLRILHIYLKI